MQNIEAVIRSEALVSLRALRLNQGVSDVTVSVLVDTETWLRAATLPKPDVHSGEYVWGLDLGQSVPSCCVRRACTLGRES